MFFKKVLLASLIFLLPLFAEENIEDFDEQYDELVPRDAENSIASVPMLANLEIEPSAIVNGVNVITGSYSSMHTDITIPGPETLSLLRCYSSNGKSQGNLSHGWNFNHQSKVGIRNVRKPTSPYIVFKDGFGSKIGFLPTSKKKIYSIAPNSIQKHVTNTHSGQISARGNVKNTQILEVDLEFDQSKNCKVKDGSGAIKYYTRKKGKVLKDCDYYIQKEVKPTGNTFRYTYEEEKPYRMTKVTLFNKQNLALNSISMEYPYSNLKNPFLKVTTYDQRSVQYDFHHKDKTIFLKSVKCSDAPLETYDYHNGYLSRKSLPDNRFQEIRYYNYNEIQDVDGEKVTLTKGDQRPRRVKLQLAPVGTDSTPIVTHRFLYQVTKKWREPTLKDPHKYYPGAGHVDVKDAYHKKTRYHFDENQRLTSVLKHTGGQNQYNLYSSENLYWGASGVNHTNLLARTFTSAKDGMQFSRHFIYDGVGNISEEYLYGNLSGANTTLPSVGIQGNQISPNCEVYAKSYAYSNDGRNLLTRESNFRKHIYYTYVPGTDLVASKMTWGAGQHIRQFFEYDVNGVLNKEIIDDGSTTDKNNLTSVTERKIKYIHPKTAHPVGLPLTIEEKGLNLSTGQEILITKVLNHYTMQGLLVQQDRYDSGGNFVCSRKWQYDAMNNVILETDPYGNTISYKYDANNNKIYERNSLRNLHNEFVYDYSNRLIRTDEVYDSGLRLPQTIRYDYLGNKIGTTDIHGNETQYVYDDFSRLIQTIHPLVSDEHGSLVNPVETVQYDAMSNPIAKIDPNGNITSGTFTIRGQPCLTKHPDGSCEQILYHPDGTVKKTISKNIFHIFNQVIDYQGRTQLMTYYADNGTLHDHITTDYSAFHMTSQISMSGLKTQYTYDYAGRLSSLIKQDRLTTYSYDNLNRLHKIYEYFGESNLDYIVQVQNYDLLDRLILQQVEDSQGNILRKIQYGYDGQNNRNVIRNFSEAGETVSHIIYNGHNQPCSIIDAEGNSVVITYNYQHVNEFGQRVLHTETTDPLGNVTATTYDALKRVVNVSKRNAMGKVLHQQKLAYDKNGNSAFLTENVISDSTNDSTRITAWTYDSMNRMTSITEAVGTPNQKKTSIVYNSYGQKQCIVKPDGVVIDHKYDDLGRLIDYKASDNSIHYAFKFDLNSNPIKIDDLVNGTSNMKVYDLNNRLAQETLNNGLTIQYVYDRMDRTVKVTIPDNTSVTYKYAGIDLRQVSKIDELGNIIYSHTYENYDMSGNLLVSKLIGQAGTTNYTNDILGRTTKITAPHWQSELTQYDKVSNLLERTVSDINGSVTCQYSYNDLYQLKSESGHATHTYLNDSIFNRVNKDGRAYVVNELNQILSDSQNTYSYDYNGNMITQVKNDQEIRYAYDALGRLISANTPSQTINYTYDSENRRLSKTVGNTNTVNFLYIGQNEVGSCNAAGAMQEYRVLGAGKGAEIGSAISIEVQNRVFAPVHDHNGNVVALLDSITGDLEESYRYSAFGEEELIDNHGNQIDNSINPWRFSSKRFDPETGLVYFGRRYYNPEIGKWITPDPVGLEAGPNVYAYVSNNPLTRFDLYGLVEAPADVKRADPNQIRNFTSAIGNKLKSLARAPGRIIEYVGRNWVPIPLVRDGIEILGRLLAGRDMAFYKPSWKRRSYGGIVGDHFYTGDDEFAHYSIQLFGCMIPVLNNGICTPSKSAKKNAQKLSDALDGAFVGYWWNSTETFFEDIFESVLQMFGIYTSCQDGFEKFVLSLSDRLMDGIFASSKIELMGHSQGGLMVCAAEKKLQPIKHRINATTFGTPSIVPKDAYNKVENHVTPWDFVTWFDAGTIAKALKTGDSHVIMHETEGPVYKAHFIDGDTYGKAIEKKIERLKIHGGA